MNDALHAVTRVLNEVVLKLIANRGKDRRDLAGLVVLDGLDWDYIEQACREWDLLDRLSEVRAKA